jgi:hypothetical protein
MHPAKVDRHHLIQLTDLPNIGPALADDLRRIGYLSPQALAGADAFDMYARLCAITGQRHDPCVLDAFLSVTDFMRGAEPRPWWEYTPRRKALCARGARGG